MGIRKLDSKTQENGIPLRQYSEIVNFLLMKNVSISGKKMLCPL